jgi:hypothetical protein
MKEELLPEDRVIVTNCRSREPFVRRTAHAAQSVGKYISHDSSEETKALTNLRIRE